MLDTAAKTAMVEVLNGIDECSTGLEDLMYEARIDTDTFTIEHAIESLQNTREQFTQMLDEQVRLLKEAMQPANVQVASL